MRYRWRIFVAWLIVHGVSGYAATVATWAPEPGRRGFAVNVLIFSTVTGFVLFQLWLFGPRVAALLSDAARVASHPEGQTQPLVDRLNRGAVQYKALLDVVGKIIVPIVVAVFGSLTALIIALGG